VPETSSETEKREINLQEEILDSALRAGCIVGTMDSVNSSQLITIGKFARIGGVSIKALRLYAKLDLLHPDEITPKSRYRLYSRGQLAKLHRILQLKNVGLGLAQIGHQLSANDEVALSKLRENLASRAEEIQRQLSWVEAEIHAARNGTGSVVPSVVIKRTPRMRVSSQRERIDSYDQADTMLRDLGRHMLLSDRLVSGAIWHDCGNSSRTIDCEVFWILNRTAQNEAAKEFAPATVASVLHEGDESTIGATYEAAQRWIRDNRFKIIGPNREIYLGATGTEPDGTLIEIQFPIGKR
jgi:DNA-binding transcriptional MerR regulator